MQIMNPLINEFICSGYALGCRRPFLCWNEVNLLALVKRSRKNISSVSGSQCDSNSIKQANVMVIYISGLFVATSSLVEN
jgi:hypothetical protein